MKLAVIDEQNRLVEEWQDVYFFEMSRSIVRLYCSNLEKPSINLHRVGAYRYVLYPSYNEK